MGNSENLWIYLQDLLEEIRPRNLWIELTRSGWNIGSISSGLADSQRFGRTRLGSLGSCIRTCLQFVFQTSRETNRSVYLMVRAWIHARRIVERLWTGRSPVAVYIDS